jgi:hypothetical protein
MKQNVEMTSSQTFVSEATNSNLSKVTFFRVLEIQYLYQSIQKSATLSSSSSYTTYTSF